jgi:hypothetical protein
MIRDGRPVDGGRWTVDGGRWGRVLTVFGALVLSLSVCCKNRASDQVAKYIFLGHPYDWNDAYRLDPRLEKIDYSQYDQVWLGGDVCSRLTEKPETLDYLDSLLDFSDEHVQWTLGNHDVMFGHPERIRQKTGKESFYVTPIDGITLLVLNTNLFWMYDSRPEQVQCEERQAQYELIRSVLDTIQNSSHLVILHHHALLKSSKPVELRDAFNTNPAAVAMTCDSTFQFDQLIYPKLVKVQEGGIQVVLVGGDLGMRVKRFEYRTPEGIWLLGSGINNSLKKENKPEYVTTFDPDEVLIFKHDPIRQTLEWEFVRLDDMVRELEGE